MKNTNKGDDFVKARVVFVFSSFAGGGSERVLVTLANSLSKDKFEVICIALTASGPILDELDSCIPVHDLGCARLRSGILFLLWKLRKLAPTHIVTTMAYMNFGVLLTRYCTSFEAAVIVREANEPEATFAAGPPRPLMKWLYQWLYPRAAAVICPSIKIESSLRLNVGISGMRSSVLHNPIDQDRLRRLAVPLRRHPGNGRRFVAAGRLVSQKGFDRLLNIFSDCDPLDHLTILGDGPEHAVLANLATRLGISSRVTFKGFVKRPWSWFAGADAVLLTSRWEGMPNVALEGLACGTPVVATPESGGISEVAAEAPRDAVMIAPIGDEYILRLKDVKASQVSDLRPSLLPASFELTQVVSGFENLLLATSAS